MLTLVTLKSSFLSLQVSQLNDLSYTRHCLAGVRDQDVIPSTTHRCQEKVTCVSIDAIGGITICDDTFHDIEIISLDDSKVRFHVFC